MIYPPLCGVECSGLAQHPVLLPTPSFCSQLFRNGSWDFCLFVSFGPEFAPTAHASLFSLSYNFFVFSSSRIGVSRCKHCSMHQRVSGPRPDS